MNPDTTPLAHGCMIALGLEATNDEQFALQEQCDQILNNLFALEELLELDPLSYPEIEQ